MNKNRADLDLNEIIKKYKPLVSFKVKQSIGNNYPDWEDVVNEIMCNIIEQIQKGKFRGDSSIGTFIYIITQRRIIDYIREKKNPLNSSQILNLFQIPLISRKNRKKNNT
ncbi:MAG: sigma-70 family RNA polymerase sigma factor [Candidatus Aminicenantaceae bacterium]